MFIIHVVSIFSIPFFFYFKQKYDNSLKIPRSPVCTENRKVTALMREESGYEFNDNKPEEAYSFRMTIYNRCGSLGQVKNIEFEEAIKKVSGNDYFLILLFFIMLDWLGFYVAQTL